MDSEEYKLLIERKEVALDCLNRAKKWLIDKRPNKYHSMFEEALIEINNVIKDYEVLHSIILPDTVEEPVQCGVIYEISDEINEPGPSGVVYEINEPGPSNKLQFEGIFKGKESEIRITPDKRISVFDFIRVVGGQKNPRKTWDDIKKKYKNEVVTFCDNWKFEGARQKLTPVINVQGMVKLLFWLPGEMAKQFRSKSAEKLIEYLGGNPSLINEVSDEIQEINEPGPSDIVSTFDYSSLVQNSNETTGFKSDLLQELNNEFNTEEQSIFINSFYSYLNHHPTEDFVVDLDVVYKFIGFSRKADLKKLLLKNFSEGTDYQTLLINSDKQKSSLRREPQSSSNNGKSSFLPKEKSSWGGSSPEKIMLNVDTFKGLCMLARTEQAKIIRAYYIKLQELIIKCKNKQNQELTLYNEPGPSNQLQFEGIFKGKESEIRITPDKRISVFDFIRVVGGQSNPQSVWKRLVNEYKKEIIAFCDYSQFGKTKKTPVINVQGMVKLLFWLPGEMAKQFRSKSAEVMIRYLGGDLSLINEIKQIDNHHVTNPNNVAQIFREEVSENQIQPVQKQSNFNPDQINNSKRLLEYFGDKKNVIYNLIFNHKDFGWLSKIGIVRELRGFHERFKEHQEAFGEVCIHSVIQCTNIEQVERDFKDTSLFQTNKVKVPKNGDGNYTEIMKLTELNTMETISNEIKRIANDRILDPPPMYSQQQLTENTHVNSLEIEKEKTRQIESQSDKEIRLAQIQADKEIKLADLETKKLEFEMLKFKVANNIPIT
jgi:hypothetical protein